MFACELEFHDGVSPTEVIFVRRPFAVIGSNDYAHVVIEGSARLITEVRVVRGLGRSFRCEPLQTGASELRLFPGGEYSGDGEFDLGGVTVRLTSIDTDLHMRQQESMDQAGVRILRRALATPTSVFPAVAVLGTEQLYTSFSVDEGLLIGRSRSCGLRLDSADVSTEHAKITFERGRFYIEDLESTNGTFINSLNGERVKGRRVIEEGERICIGSEVILECIGSERALQSVSFDSKPQRSGAVTNFPSIVAFSEAVRPSRFAFNRSDHAIIGRDPTSDIWVAASHISRTHAEMIKLPEGGIEIIDRSSNGTYLDGKRLPKDQPITLSGELRVVDFNSGILLGVCFSKDDEVAFLEGNISEKKTTVLPSGAMNLDSGESQAPARTEGKRKRVTLTPLEELAAGKQKTPVSEGMQKTQVFEKLADPLSDWKDTKPRSNTERGPVKAPSKDFSSDASGFQRLAQRDSWGAVPNGGSSASNSAVDWDESESGTDSEREFDSSLLLYDESPKAPLGRMVFIVACAGLVLLIAFVLTAM